MGSSSRIIVLLSRFSWQVCLSLLTLLAIAPQRALSQVMSPPAATTGTVPSAPYRRPMFGVTTPSKVTQVSKYGGGRALPDDIRKGVKTLLALPPSAEELAPFVGQNTAILASTNNGFVMARQANCSLSTFNVPYMMTVNDPYSSPYSITTDYDQQLHVEAGLTTTAGVFNIGCGDPKIGVPASDLVYAGKSTGGMRMSAAALYDGSLGYPVLYTFLMTSNGTYVSSAVQSLPGGNLPMGVVAADINNDGNPDLIAVGTSDAGVAGASTSATMITVLLGNADGTFTVGQTYTLTTSLFTDSVVIDDFNGDGKLDVVVAEGGAGGPGGVGEKLTFLPGKGDGTLGTPVSLTLSTTTAESVISADFNGDGKKDILSGTGWLYVGNGDGTFQMPTTLAFPKPQTSSSAVGGLASGDFNKDGKLDVAVGNGDDIFIYLGNGNGTFTAGNAYASIDNHGGLTATDLDGDGNIDLYSGDAHAGVFSGDDFTANAGYALMGRGDGTFVGAPVLNGPYFVSMQDLNGDGKLDFIGVTGDNQTNFNPVFSTYFGNGDGTFRQAAGSLTNTTVTYQGAPYQIKSIDSFTTGDINGDGRPDLIYMAVLNSAARGLAQGFVTSISNADGSFQAPIFTPAYNLGGGDISGLLGFNNQTGKFEIFYSYTDEILNSNNSVTYNTGYATQVANGDGTFAAPVSTVLTSSTTNSSSFVTPSSPVAVGDLNNDKIPDLITWVQAVYNTSGSGNPVLVTPGEFQVMLGKADGTFAATITIPINNVSVVFGTTPVAIGDVNGDGIPDVVALGTDANGDYYLGVALGKGDGAFVAQAPFYSPMGFDFGSPVIADFTGDGKADIAYTTFPNASGNAVYVGNGDGTFQGLTTTSGGTPAVQPLNIVLATDTGPAAAYDVNGDGRMDLVSSGVFLLQTGSVGTAPPVTASTTALTASPTSVTAGTSVTLTATVTGPSGNTAVPTGTITFLDGTTSLGTGSLNGSGVVTLAIKTLIVGAHSITAAYGGDSYFAASSSSTATVTVIAGTITPMTSATQLTTSATSIVSGTSVIFTASVVGPSGNTTVPTGTVTFLNGTASIGTGALNGSGVATLSISTLPVGTASINASYGGDANFASSTSSAVAVTVTASPDFTITLSPNSASVTGGSSTTTTISIQPAGGFNQPVTFTCSGLPSGAACSFSPSTLTPGGSSAATTVLTLATTAASAKLARLDSRDERDSTAIAWSAILFGLGALTRRRRQWRRGIRALQMFAIGTALMGFVALSGCGGSSSKSQTSSITVTATAGVITHSTTFSLTVK
jgi:hypothetical protein